MLDKSKTTQDQTAPDHTNLAEPAGTVRSPDDESKGGSARGKSGVGDRKGESLLGTVAGGTVARWYLARV